MKVAIMKHNFSLKVKIFRKCGEISFRKHGFSWFTIKYVYS